MENKSSDAGYRQSTRSTPHIDAIDCIVNTNDLALENEMNTKEKDRHRDSRRDATSRYPNESSTHRSSRYSPPSMNRKRHASPRSISSSRSHHNIQTQKLHRISPPSPSPPPVSQSSSKLHRSTNSAKRTHSPSRASYERHPPAHRSRHEVSKERTSNSAHKLASPFDEQTTSKPSVSTRETTDSSFVSEDELPKQQDTRSNSMTTIESALTTNNNKLHSTPSAPLNQSNPNDSLLEMSTIPQECELSLFPKSSLSMTNTSSSVLTSNLSANDVSQIVELIAKYKTMLAMPFSNPQIEAFSQEILNLIQKQIELQKIEQNCREREIRLRERELAEREKRFNERLTDASSTNVISNESLVPTKLAVVEEKPQKIASMIDDQDLKNVSEEESVEKPTSPIIAESKINQPNTTGSGQAPLGRKKTGKSRFSPSILNTAALAAIVNPTIDLYADDQDDGHSSPSLKTDNASKKEHIPKIQAVNEAPISIADTDLKVTSSNSCRKVEFQSGNTDKTVTSKGSTHDLRLTLSKNRTKNNGNNGDHFANTDPLINSDESTTISSKATSSRINIPREDKQQSDEYQPQRSVTSVSIEPNMDDANDKRDSRHYHQQRINSNYNRRQQNSSSSIRDSKERSYPYEPTSQQMPKYGMNQRRHETDDLRSHLYEHKNPKSSRITHRNNY